MAFTLDSASIRFSFLFYHAMQHPLRLKETVLPACNTCFKRKAEFIIASHVPALQSSHNASGLDGLALLCDLPKLDTRTVYKNTVQESLRSEMLSKHEALLFLFLLFLRYSCLKR